MAFYYLTGRLGSGKNLMAVSKIREKLEAGCPVATNVDLDLRKLLGDKCKDHRVVRLPDFPSSHDLAAIGEVDNEDDEERNGLVVLDEGGMMLNARAWTGDDRAAIIRWFLHSRKLGWDVIIIVQAFNMIDKQLREACSEFVVSMRRMDRMAVPFISWVVRILTFGFVRLRLPRVHVGAVMYGTGPSAMNADTWYTRGTIAFGAYRTKQRFSADYEHGAFSMLRYSSLLPKPRQKASTVQAQAQPGPAPVVAVKPKLVWVQRVAQLPPDRRIDALRTLGIV